MVNFNEYQLKVLELSSGKHACMASAGSGKTEVLTERLQKSLSDGVKAEDILCITFTNRAALSMLDRVKGKIPSSDLDEVFVGNTHALALKLLNDNRFFPYSTNLCTPDVAGDLWRLSETRFHVKLQESLSNKYQDYLNSFSESYQAKEFNLEDLKRQYSEQDLQPVRELFNLKEISGLINLLKLGSQPITVSENIGINKYLLTDLMSVKSENPKKINYQQIYSVIKPLLDGSISKQSLIFDYVEFLKDRLKVTYFETELSTFEISLSTMLATAFYISREYEKLKKHFLMYDFDDALCSSLKLTPKNYKWVQVDECQDLSPIQWLILKYHTDSNAHLLMLGDVNQSIYRFLGASIETTISELGSSNFELPINYRSPENLVNFFKEYMSFNFPNRFSSEVKSYQPDSPNALIHVHRETQNEQIQRLMEHARKLVTNGKVTAFLCPTNKLVDQTSEYFSSIGIEHFRISQNDILSSRAALDFFSFIRCLNDENDHLSWARLLWNFSSIGTLKNANGDVIFTPQLHSLHLVSQLVNLGGSLADFAFGEDVYDHLSSRFVKAYEEGYVYFDTETTGLEVDDNIIQIAGVNIQSGENVGEIDVYCLSDKSVGESEKIHKISDQKLASSGRQFNEQFKAFQEFSEAKTLIAHNLEFDRRMMVSNISKHCSNKVEKFEKTPMLCSLNLARRLFPDLKSHKLGGLLSEFLLDGVNSHNAIDDVRAGANFVEFVKHKVYESSSKIDELIDANESTFQSFGKKANSIFGEIKKLSSKNIDLEILFDFYFDFVREHKAHEINEGKVQELRNKLIKWSSKLFKPMALNDFISNIAPILTTLKESDLITSEDNLVVSTIHKSKGLEFDYVILPSVVDATFPAFPIQMMKQSDEKTFLIQEQKRLLYVGMTRAKKQLVIGTYNEFLSPYGKCIYTRPCSFMGGLFRFMKRY